MDKKDDLWQGGLWEQEKPNYPVAPPVVIPPPSVKTEKSLSGKKKSSSGLSLGAKVGFGGFVSLILSLVCLTVVIGLDKDRDISIFGDGFTDWFSFDRLPEWFTDDFEKKAAIIIEPMSRPSIRSASYNEDVTLEFTAVSGNALSSQEVYEKCMPSVVFIEAENLSKFATGTGVIMSEDGYIVTNAHVIESASKATVTLWNNQRYEATMVGYNFDQDLAVLKIEAEGLVAAEFGDSSLLRVGDMSYALGNPLGSDYRYTFTDGMISSVDRMLKVEDVSVIFVGTTAPINSGNSGGALINEFGQVIGITTIKIESEDNTVEGMGFAIPSLRVKQVVNRLMVGAEIYAPMIGVTVYSVYEPVFGIMVHTVDKNSIVYEVGLRSGDIIMEANGKSILTVDDLNAVKGYLFVGDEIEYLVYRDGEELLFTAELLDFELEEEPELDLEAEEEEFGEEFESGEDFFVPDLDIFEFFSDKDYFQEFSEEEFIDYFKNNDFFDFFTDEELIEYFSDFGFALPEEEVDSKGGDSEGGDSQEEFSGEEEVAEEESSERKNKEQDKREVE